MTNQLLKPNNHTPGEIIKYGEEAAKTLNQIVRKAGWVVKIAKNDYLQFEAWQTVARFYGLSARTVSTKFVEYGTAKGFEARAEVVDKESKIIGAAESVCLDDEKNWTGKPLYALKSMAQTRACAKALRQILSWVVVLAGYKPTPAEEVNEEVIKPPTEESVFPTCKDCGKKIADIVNSYSQEKYGRALCFDCQKKERENQRRLY